VLDRRLLIASFVIPAVGMLGACDNPERWKFREEVILNDGTQIVASRVALRNNVWPHISTDGYRAVVNQWLSYRPLGVDVELKGLGRHAYQTFSLGLVQGKPHLAVLPAFVTPELSRYCNAHPAGYKAYFWAMESSGWKEVEQTDALLDTLTYNLMEDLSWDDGAPSHELWTIDLKSSRAKHDFRQRTSAREFLKGVFGANCSYKG
jgi:hypothetical protein